MPWAKCRSGEPPLINPQHFFRVQIRCTTYKWHEQTMVRKFSKLSRWNWTSSIREKGSTRVVVNISGEIYETQQNTLQRFPHTLLGDRRKRSFYYCPRSGQYFFQRSKLFFDAILFFYQSNGILSRPYGIPYDLFAEECRFFQLPEQAILKAKPKDFKSIVTNKGETDVNPASLKSTIWNILQNPKTSTSARIFSSFSLFLVTVSVTASCLQSIPSLERHEPFNENPWYILELVLNTFFLLELILCCATTPDRKKFFTSKMTLIDIISVIPYFFVLAVSKEKLHSFNGLRIVRMARVVVMLRFSKHSRRIALIGRILLSCMADLKTLLICVFMIVLIAGSFIYFVEKGHEGGGEQFTCIPIGCYWAIQTLFTVGYGDIVPLTFVGRVFAGGYMLVGSTLLCLPLLSLIARFQAEWDFDHVMPSNDFEDECVY